MPPKGATKVMKRVIKPLPARARDSSGNTVPNPTAKAIPAVTTPGPSTNTSGSDASKADSALDKAKQLFTLYNPQKATEKGWETYITNRLAARKFPGYYGKEKVTKNGDDDDDDEEDEEDEDEDEDDFFDGADGSRSIEKWIKDALIIIDNKKDLGMEGKEEHFLAKGFRVLYCDAMFEEMDEPRTVTTLTRLYSPTQPVYIDVHFFYHCRSRSNSIEWSYRLGYKIHTRATPGDLSTSYVTSAVSRFEKASFEGTYTSHGWRPIAYGFFDDDQAWGKRWKRAEVSAFQMGEEEVLDVYEALWGPLEENLAKYEGDDGNDVETIRRQELVGAVQTLLAAVGIKYTIACDDDKFDNSGRVWMLEGLADRWFARETRKACGFQLTEDPAKEAKGKESKREEMSGRLWDDDDGEDEEYDSDGNPRFGSEDEDDEW